MITLLLRAVIVIAVVIAIIWWHKQPQEDYGEESIDSEESSLADVFKDEEKDVESHSVSRDGESGTEREDEQVSDESVSEEAVKKVYDLSDIPNKKKNDVPFVTQAPEAQWEDTRFQDACEEASILMAYQWVGGDRELSKKDATAALEEIFKAEIPLYGKDVIDTSAEDTKKLMEEFFGHKVAVENDITMEQMIYHLAEGALLIIPTDGTKLKNPYFSGDGPERHMLVVTGYDQKKEEFIVNDPGTRRGKNFRYKMDVLYGAVRDYETGIKKPIDGIKKNMIIVTK